MTDEDDSRPVGFLGKLRNQKTLVWVVIIALLVLTIGASTIAFILQAVLPGL